MLYKEFQPDISLSHLIKCFWMFENEYPENHLERMIPDGYIDWVYHYGQKPILIIDGKEIVKPSNFLGGHLISSAQLKFSGELKMFGIKFYPWASSFLYPMPAHELNNVRLEAEAIGGKWIKEYYSFMMDELNIGNFLSVIQCLEKELKKMKFSETHSDKILKKSFDFILNSKGDISIDDVSNMLGCSARHVQKIFHERRGMPFSFFCKLARFQNVIHIAQANPSAKLIEVAYEGRYYDQSHFIKDFTQLTGLSPKKFFAEKHIYLSENTHSIITKPIGL